MSAEEAYLRRRLVPGLVRRIEYNWANRNRDIRLFEVGTVFRRGTGAPEEWTSVAGVLTGARRPAHWSEGAKAPDMDIWDLKYHFELAVAVADLSCDVRPATGGAVGWVGVQSGGRGMWMVCGRGVWKRWRASLAYDGERADAQVLDQLETILRQGADGLAGGRARAVRAEGELKETAGRAGGGGGAGSAAKPDAE